MECISPFKQRPTGMMVIHNLSVGILCRMEQPASKQRRLCISRAQKHAEKPLTENWQCIPIPMKSSSHIIKWSLDHLGCIGKPWPTVRTGVSNRMEFLPELGLCSLLPSNNNLHCSLLKKNFTGVNLTQKTPLLKQVQKGVNNGSCSHTNNLSYQTFKHLLG